MPKITLDDIEYNSEDLSEEGLKTLKSLQFLELQMNKLRHEIAIYQTAKRTYVTALEEEIQKSGMLPISETESKDE